MTAFLESAAAPYIVAAFVALYLLAVAAMVAWAWRQCSKPLSDLDRYCSRVDEELDRLAAERGERLAEVYPLRSFPPRSDYVVPANRQKWTA